MEGTMTLLHDRLEILNKIESSLTSHVIRDEATRCLQCEDAPCSQACPADIDIPEFIRKIVHENELGGIRALRSANVLAGACGLNCPAEQLCQGKCILAETTGAIRIGALQTYLMGIDWQKQYSMRHLSLPTASDEKRIAVIGAGPAGLAAACALLEMGVMPVVFDPSPEIGGLLSNGIPSFKEHADFLAYELDWIARHVNVQSSALGHDFSLADLREKFLAVILCFGSRQSHDLQKEWTSIPGVFGAREILYQPSLFEEGSNTNVVIIGGGDVAFDVARSAKEYGAKRIDILCLEMPDQVVCSQENMTDAFREGMFIHHGTMLSQVMVEHAQLASISAQRIRWRIPGSLDPSNAEVIQGSDFSLRADKLILAIGSLIPSTLRQHLEQAGIQLTHGLIAIDESYATSLPGVYACGDAIVSTAPRLIVQAVKEGKAAAAAAADYVTRKQARNA